MAGKITREEFVKGNKFTSSPYYQEFLKIKSKILESANAAKSESNSRVFENEKTLGDSDDLAETVPRRKRSTRLTDEDEEICERVLKK